MHGIRLLHTLLSKSCSKIHISRLASLIQMVEASLCSNKLSLVSLGRHLAGEAVVKHKIKQADRLLGNSHLYEERRMIYGALAKICVAKASRPIILVDWSGVTHCGQFHMIRASIPYQGRTLTIYEEVYTEKQKDSPKANRMFLTNLSRILPAGCQPIIVSDAGFRNPWFKEVLKLGWDFVGRVRNKTHVCLMRGKVWKACKTLYKKATPKAQSLGHYLLAKSNPLACHLVLMKGKKQYRQKKNLKGHQVRCSSSLKHAKRNKEPWLIATSLAQASANKVVRIYKLRMAIEQGFRDIKNQRLGVRASTSVDIVSLPCKFLL